MKKKRKGINKSESKLALHRSKKDTQPAQAGEASATTAHKLSGRMSQQIVIKHNSPERKTAAESPE